MSAIRSSKERYSIGKGIVSGYLSIFLSLLCFAGVLCFRFTEQLTTPAFREVYTGESMKWLLTCTLIASLLFGLINLLFSRNRKTGNWGILVACITIVLGGFDVQGRSVEKTNWHLGLDWLILDLFIMAIIFLHSTMDPEQESKR
jgi:lathosterol oxidase